MGRKPTLSRDDWIAAAADWIAEHGVAALAIEPLARALGLSKGAVYWHFASRDALLQAVLERWEAQGTQAIIELVEAMPDSAQHAEQLIRVVTRTVTDEGSQPARVVRLQYALWCAASDPLVGPSVERATAARIDYLARVLEQAGLAPAVAADRARIGYASYVGMVMLQATRGRGRGVGLDAPSLVHSYLAMLLAR